MQNFQEKKTEFTKEFQELAQIIIKADIRQKEILGVMKFIEQVEKETKENSPKEDGK